MACLTESEFIEQATEKFELSPDEIVKARKIYRVMRDAQSRHMSSLEKEVAAGDYVDNYLLEQYVEQFPNGVPVKYNGSAKVVYAKLAGVVEAGEYTTLQLANGTEYTFKHGQDRSVDTKKGTHIVVPGLGKYTNTLGSKKGTHNWDNLKEEAGYEHLSKSSMVDTLNKLVKLETLDSKEAEYYKELLGKIDGKFTRKLRLFIKRTSNESYGEVDGKSIRLAVNNKKQTAANQQTAAEVYMHEVWHSLISFGLRDGTAEARKAVRELEYIRSHAKQKITWRAFLPEASINKELEEIKAKEQYDYVFNSENSLDEFAAYAITNPQLRRVLSKVKVAEVKHTDNLLEKLMDIVDTLINVVLGNFNFKDKNSTVYDKVYNLSMDLADAKKNAQNEVSNAKKVATAINDVVDKIDYKIATKLNEWKNEYLVDGAPLEEYPSKGGKTAKAAWTLKLLKKSMVNAEYGKALGLIASSYGVKPDGVIRNVLKDFREPSDWEKAAEFLQLESDRIEAQRNSQISSAKRVVADGFTRRLTKEEERSLLRIVVDLDMQSLPEKKNANQPAYDTATIRKLLTDKVALEKAIGNAKHRLEKLDPKYANWHKVQAHGLGYYLATGKAGIAQNFNAKNIARGLISNHYKTPEPAVVRAIDEVATLVGMLYADPRDKLTVAELLKEQRSGVFNVMAVHRGYNKESYKTLFGKNSSQMIKGYSKEVFDDSMITEVAPIADKEELEAAGFKFVGEVSGKHGDINAQPMGLYVSGSLGRNEYLRSMTRLTRTGSKGTTVSESRYADGGDFAKERAYRDIAKLDIERLKIVNEMLKGTYDVEKADMGLAPVLNETGEVVNYRYMMSKEQKEKLLKQDTRVIEVLGRTYGSMFDRLNSKEHNKKVIKFILDNMKNDWEGGLLGKDGLTEYTVISSKSKDPKIKELYSILPKAFKDAINARADKSIAVPTHMMPMFFGYRHLMLADTALAKLLPRIAREALKIAETMWVELAKIAKTNILLKMPSVLYDNIRSNIMQEIVDGGSLTEVLNDYKESFRDVRGYITKHREMSKLVIKQKAGTATKAELEQIKTLEVELKRNPVHELMELGMYQAFQEDVENIELRGSNKWKQVIDEKLEKVPSYVRTPLQWLYLSEETAYYKVSQEVLQMSDLIARDVMNRRLKRQELQQANGHRALPVWWVSKQEKGYKEYQTLKGNERKQFLAEAKQWRQYRILQAFINYNKPASQLESWVNRVAVMRFTSYTKRIQLVNANLATEHPLRTTIAMLVNKFVTELPTTFDQSPVERGLRTFPVYSMGDTVETVVNPPLISGLRKVF